MPKILHDVFSKPENWGNQEKGVLDYLKSPNFTEDQYVNLLSGKYEGASSYEIGELPNKLKNNRFNTPKNNDKVISNILKQKPDRDYFWESKLTDSIIQNLNHSKKSLDSVIDFVKNAKNEKEKAERTEFISSKILKSPELTDDQFKKIVKDLKIVNDDVIQSPKLNKKLFDDILKEKDFKYSILPGSVFKSKLLDSKNALKILNKGLIRSEHHLDSLLNKIPKSARKDYINSKLGITGGEVSPGVGGYYSDEWFHGPQRDEAASSVITRSKHLTPEIIEHIKKYGNFNEKYNLFRNEHVDPKHAVEMAGKWAGDEEGYSEKDLKERLKEESEDSIWDHYSDDAREKAQEAYPMDKFLKDIGDDEVSKTLFDKDYDTWKKDWILENENLEGPNPGFDPNQPESEDNPKNIPYDGSYGSSLDVEDHPDWSNYDTNAEEAFEEAKNRADMEPFYENYDEAIREDIDRNIYDLRDEDLENWHSTDRFLPEHVYEKLKNPYKDKENPTEKELEEALDHPLQVTRYGAAENKKLPSSLIDKVLKGDDDDLKSKVLENPNVTSDQLMRTIKNSDSEDNISSALQNKKIKPDHLHEAVKRHNQNGRIMQNVFDSDVADDNHVKNYLQTVKQSKYPQNYNLDPIVDSKFNLAPEDVDFIFNTAKGQDRNVLLSKLIEHPNSTKDMINWGLNHPDKVIQYSSRKIQDRKFPPTADPVNVKSDTHPLRILRDIISEQGGTSTKGKLKTLGMNPDKFSSLFKPNGTITSEDVQKVIDSAPSKKYNTSHTTWDGAQRHSGELSKVFQLNYTQDHLNEMEKEGVLNTFQRIYDTSYRSGHPVKNNTIGWVRYTGSPEEGFHIDEIQSDLGQSLIKQTVQQTREAVENGAMTPEQAETAINNAKNSFPDEDLKKINKILFGDKHPSEVLHEGFKEYIRGKGFADAPIHIWQPESKAPISGMETSTTISPSDAKQIIDDSKKGKRSRDFNTLMTWAQKNKLVPSSFKDVTEEHLDQVANKYSEFANNHREKHSSDPKLPVSLPVHMVEGYGKIPKAMGYKESTYGKLPTQQGEQFKADPETNKPAAATYEEKIRKFESQPTTLYHYSREKGLKTLDPKKQGMGVKGDHTKRALPYQIKNYPHVTFYYINDTPEDIVRSAANAKYTVKLEPHQKLYDIYNDPEGLAMQAVKENQMAWNYEKIFNKIKDAGYHGIISKDSEHPVIANTVMIFHPHPVHEELKP